MSKTVDVLLSRRVTIGVGEAAGDHEAGAKVTVSESVADSIIDQGAGVVVEAEKPVKASKKAAEPAAPAAPEAAPVATDAAGEPEAPTA